MNPSFDACLTPTHQQPVRQHGGLKVANRHESIFNRKMLLQPEALMLTAALTRQLLASLALPEQQSGYQGDRERAAAQEEEKR